MIKPVLQDEAFLADIEAAESDKLHIWWIGQMGYLVRYGDLRFVLDPYLSDSLTKKYAPTDKPHDRMTENVIDPGLLTNIAFVTTSHNHTDHLDKETLLPLFEANPDAVLVYPAPNAEFIVSRLGAMPSGSVGFEIGQTQTVGGIEITALPAAHEELSPEFVGYILRVGPWTIYHAGDTIPFEGMADGLRPFGIDVALMPINGRVPARRVVGNMWGDEAARIAKEFGAGLAIPGHYELFEFNSETPDLFVKTCEEVGQPFRVLKAGERFSL